MNKGMTRLLPLLLAAFLLAPAAEAAAPSGSGWQQTEAGLLTFHYRPKDAGIARALAAAGPAAVEEIGRRTGVSAPGGIDVVLAPTFADFAQAQPGAPPSWAAGTAYARRGEVYLRTRMPRTGADPIDKVFVHELVHVLLGERFGDQPIPRWLNEGAAQLFAGELSTADHATLVQAAIGGGLLPLSSITDRWPQSPAKARLAYAQSVDFVAFLADQREDALSIVIDALARAEPLDTALERGTGRDLSALEESWRGRMTFWHAVIPVLGGSGVTWGIGSIIFMIAGWRRRRAFHRKVAAMGARERALAPGQPLDGAWQIQTTALPEGWGATLVYLPGDGEEPPEA